MWARFREGAYEYSPNSVEFIRDELMVRREFRNLRRFSVEIISHLIIYS